MVIDKLSLYNNALQEIGERKLSSTSDDTEARYKLDTAWDLGAVEFCLDLVKPHWATSVKKLNTPTTSAEHDLGSVHALPANYVALVGLFSDAKLDQRVHRYLIEDRTIACEFATVYLRYVKNDPASSFTNWTPNFARVVAAYLAREIVGSVAPAKTDFITNWFTEAVETAITLEGFKEPDVRSSRSTNTINALWLKIYNDALQCMHMPHMIDANDDSQARSALDIALDNDLVENLLEEINWAFPHTLVKITQDPSLEPDWGYRYVFNKPSDILRLRGIFQDEYARHPLKDYADEGGNFYCELTELWLDYIPNTSLEDPSSWPANFRKLVAATMARDAAGSVPGANVLAAEAAYKERLNRSKSIDANQSPPVRIASGSWVRSRGGNRRDYRGRP